MTVAVPPAPQPGVLSPMPPTEALDGLVGCWVASAGGVVLAHGSTPQEAAIGARSCGRRLERLFRVPVWPGAHDAPSFA